MAMLKKFLPVYPRLLRACCNSTSSRMRSYYWRPRMFDDMFDTMKKFEREFDRFPRMFDRSSDGFGVRAIVPNFLRPFEGGLYTETVVDSNGVRKLQLHFDVRDYRPEDVKVKIVKNTVSVKAKRETKADSGSIYREFTREYILPEGLNMDDVKSLLSEDGILTLEAPYIETAEMKKGPTEIPIEREK